MKYFGLRSEIAKDQGFGHPRSFCNRGSFGPLITIAFEFYASCFDEEIDDFFR